MSFSKFRASEVDIPNISRMLYLPDTPALVLRSFSKEGCAKHYNRKTLRQKAPVGFLFI